jgi:hypothetical protein
MILPKPTLFLLPKIIYFERKGEEYKFYDYLEQFFPLRFHLDIMYGTKFIYSDPILPEIDYSIIKKHIEKVEDKLSMRD